MPNKGATDESQWGKRERIKHVRHLIFLHLEHLRLLLLQHGKHGIRGRRLGARHLVAKNLHKK